MKYLFFMVAAVLVSVLTIQCAGPVQEIKREQPGDSSLSCSEINAQIAEMDRVIQQSGIDSKSEGALISASEKSRQVGSDVAAEKKQEAIPLISDVSWLVKKNAIQRRADAVDQGYQAKSRKNYLITLSKRKGCQG